MKIAAIQHDIVWQDGPATRKSLEPLIASAASSGARLIALTEMYATGFSMDPDRVAEDQGGPNEQFLLDQAREHGVWVVGSIAQRGEDGRARNVAVLAAPDGSTHRYIKIHPFSYAGEDKHYAAGTQFCTVNVEGLRVSLFVCYDLRFADEFWQVAAQTDLYVVVANWPAVRREHWRALLQARAIENQAYILGVNRVGRAGKDDHVGDSAIIDPLGQRLTEAAHIETVLIAEVTGGQVAEVRSRFPFMADRRPVSPRST
ncbi:predicted amidohydrolase [Jatrophihabitans sp. GAS493]|uniref:nitrilase-related carbon-nitrogen hydrolase n=1 Tax=Jatrophihabitans sp. GAS493 TaxID=1907575 RepID=UPI000BB9B038|nr:nitrilase-related carbon-nitrogen hydrolase [Jatrophihabitans sp. GAS493]SOD75124.1 predicted amidohydrolase [Jatrophihabitans sp. GAS493]